MGSRDNYTFENQGSIPSPLGPLLSDFFRSWDDPYSKNDYLNVFAPDGQLVFGPAPANGRDAIRALRDAMIHPTKGPVVDLEHTLGKCFVLAGGAESGHQEIIVNGSLWYQLKNGRKIHVDFASFMVFVDKGQGHPQVEFYEVYLDSLELAHAIMDMNEAAE